MKTTAKTVTKSGRLLEALKAGEELTAAQISHRFGIANPRATVSSLRFQGYAVYANLRKDAKGRETTKYRIGNPRRAVVAAGYRAIADGLYPELAH
jgi:predicted ArsR family transcriptional regulator